MTKLRIGSRKSPLSYQQTQHVIKSLQAKGIECETKEFVTSGDRFLDAPLRTIGGKGLFTKELEEALLRGEIDCAVHSYKDMPTQLPEGLIIGAVLQREDVRDVWISRDHLSLVDLPPQSRIGTASLRRQVQLKYRFPHLEIHEIRGNLPTRIEKMHQGEVDGLILAYAGIKRLGRQEWITEIFSLSQMFPAVAQGALVVECRENDQDIYQKICFLDHSETHLCTTIERAFLGVLDGSCRTPIGGYAWIEEDLLKFKGFVASPDASSFEWIEEQVTVREVAQDPFSFGLQVGGQLRARFQRK